MSYIKTTVIIPAGGVGNRFGADIPKQFNHLSGIPVIVHTLKKFWICDNIIISSHPDWVDHLKELVFEHSIPNVKAIVKGGATRQHSVYNALCHEVAEESEVILVHDAVRPFANKELIQSIMLSAIDYGAAIPGLTPKDTIKQISKENLIKQTIDRNTLSMVQTPQGFRYNIIRKAYDNAIDNNFEGTDSASLVELIGQPVKIIEGDETNIKITTPMDMVMAEYLMREK